MPIVSSANIGGGSIAALEGCDICIIGSGPAGSTIARELSSSGLRVTLLESGNSERNHENDLLNEIESIGRARVMDQWLVRNRILGGSSHTWTGRCAAFDEIDFEKRDWVPESDWPIGLNDLSSYLDRSATYLGLSVGNGFSDNRFWSLANRPTPPGPNPNRLLPFFWQFSRDSVNPYEYMRFGRHLASQIGPNVTLVTGATVTAIVPDRSGSVIHGVEFIDLNERRRIVTARRVVLCAGGIENARLLLNSNSVVPEGLGNDHDLVGRYLMDHPRGTVARFDVAGSERLQKRFGLYSAKNNLFRAGLRLSPAIQREEKLLNCAVWLGETVTADDPWHALKRILRGKPQLPADLISISRNAGLFARGLKEYFFDRNGLPRKLDALTLECMCEQRPDPSSRITLSERRDRYGSRLPIIDWRIHADEAHSVRRTAMLAVEEFHRMGFPKPVAEEWVRDGADFPASFVDVAHPTGTTRMATDPSMGVVDANLQVHGVQGLYVAGSSVFTTAGHCNPTQMIVATAIRLSDHIRDKAKAELRSENAMSSSAREANSRATRDEAVDRHLVLVTGATGRIGRVAVRHLLQSGFCVRAATSGAQLPPGAQDGSITWQHLDLKCSDADFNRAVAGCDAVIHLGAAMTEMADMQQVNAEGTRALASAAECAGVASFVYASSVAVYGSSASRNVTEDSPVLTSDHDVRSEYMAVDQLRAYGRTKLGGELGIRAVATKTRYVILRPTVVVDTGDLLAIGDWPRSKRHIAAHRHAHHVFIEDVADALCWAMRRGLNAVTQPGAVEVFNLSDDDCENATHAEFLHRVRTVSDDARYRAWQLPSVIDWARDLAKFRTLPLRNPLWRMRFSGDRLRSVGWSPPHGMGYAQSQALRRLHGELPLSN